MKFLFVSWGFISKGQVQHAINIPHIWSVPSPVFTSSNKFVSRRIPRNNQTGKERVSKRRAFGWQDGTNVNTGDFYIKAGFTSRESRERRKLRAPFSLLLGQSPNRSKSLVRYAVFHKRCEDNGIAHFFSDSPFSDRCAGSHVLSPSCDFHSHRIVSYRFVSYRMISLEVLVLER